MDVMTQYGLPGESLRDVVERLARERDEARAASTALRDAFADVAQVLVGLVVETDGVLSQPVHEVEQRVGRIAVTLAKIFERAKELSREVK